MINQNIILIFVISIVATFLAIGLIRPFAKKIGMIDIPSKRKSHLGNIPVIGGISIFIGMFASIIMDYNVNNFFIAYMVSSFLVLLLGLIDDLNPLSVTTRLMVQICIVSSMVYFTGLKFENFGHSFGLSSQISLGYFSYPITILGIVFVTNAFNLIDGSDGVCAGLSFLAMIGINSVILIRVGFNPNPITIALIGGLITFIWFNFSKSPKNKIFLGDSGSLFLGYTIAFLLLYETQKNSYFSPISALWIVAIPIFDTLAVLVYRLKNSKKLFTPDQNHLHHFLGRLGFSTFNTFLCVFFLGLLFCIFGLFTEFNFQIISFYMFLVLLLAYVWIRVFSKFSSRNMR